MAQSLISCPLCSSASFLSINALCLSLVNISSKWLQCTVCQEEIHGLDKLTIHLLSHLTHNPDFIMLFSNDHGSSTSNVIHEPLNLAKSFSSKSKDGDCDKYFSPKDTSSVGLEKPSIKIDNEVMIVFKRNECLQSNRSIDCTPSSLSVTSSYNPPLTTLAADFNTSLDRPDLNKELFSYDRTENMPNENLYDPPSTYQCQSNTFLMKDGKSCSCTDDSHMCSKRDLKLDSDVSSSDKNKKTQNTASLDDTTTMLDVENSETSDLNNKTGIKSSFLSPNGERVLGFRCDVCSLVFPDEHILSLHRQLIHVELNDDPSKANRFKCHLCSKSFVMRGSLMVHIRVAHFGGAVVARLIETKQLENNAVSPDSAQFVCSICNKGFRKEQQLLQHEKLHDGKQCDVCLKTFTTKYFLRKHKRLHTGEMPYSCSICNKSFTFQQSYHKHLLYHSDDKPYSCPECGRAFKELSTLHNHQRIHTGEKPFSCETCGKCFRQRVSYLVHRRIHTGVLPYQCKECGKRFRYKVSERTHKCTVPITESRLDTSNPSFEKKTLESNGHSQDNMGHSEKAGGKGKNEEEVFQSVIPTEQNMSGVDSIMDSNFPEATDFFSLVMSPVDRLQHLSLATEGNSPRPDSEHQSIDTEALKELLYDVADYT